MLLPKRTKFRKSFKHKIKGLDRKSSICFGAFGLKALESSRITSRQLEAARRAITRKMKREGRVWIQIFPHIPVTAKPTAVRMGKGKGSGKNKGKGKGKGKGRNTPRHSSRNYHRSTASSNRTVFRDVPRTRKRR